MVDGAVEALMFAPVLALAFTLTLTLAVKFEFEFAGPRAQPLNAIKRARTSIRTGGLTSVFFMLTFSECFAQSAMLIPQGLNRGLEGKVHRITQY
jgi:hypothetical protein